MRERRKEGGGRREERGERRGGERREEGRRGLSYDSINLGAWARGVLDGAVC